MSTYDFEPEAKKLLAAIAATCSIMAPLSVLLLRLHNGDLKASDAFQFDPLAALSARASELGEDKINVRAVVEHFSGIFHLEEIKREGTTVGIEIPKDVLPQFHQLLPLDDQDCYSNGDVRIHLANLVIVSEGGGTGFWASHLAGKVWIPGGMDLAENIKGSQREIEGFLPSISTIKEMDFESFNHLRTQTLYAKKTMGELL